MKLNKQKRRVEMAKKPWEKYEKPIDTRINY